MVAARRRPEATQNRQFLIAKTEYAEDRVTVCLRDLSESFSVLFGSIHRRGGQCCGHLTEA